MADSDFGKLGRFEVYSIVIEKLSRDLGMISLKVGSETVQLFNKKTDMMEIGKPLQLSGPIQPISPYDPINIVFGNPKKSEWKLLINYDDAEKLDQIDRPIRVAVKDTKSDSVAVVCYGLLSEAVDANFLFSFENPFSHMYVKIFSGEIFVTTGDVLTKCLLRCFNGHSSTIIESGAPIELARSRVSLCSDSYLEVTVNLEFGATFPGHNEMIFNTNYTHRFFVPPPTPSGSPYLNPESHLRLVVNWGDELANIYAKQMDNIMPSVHALQEQLKEQGINPMEDFLFPDQVDADAAEVYAKDANCGECKMEQRTSVIGWPLGYTK